MDSDEIAAEQEAAGKAIGERSLIERIEQLEIDVSEIGDRLNRMMQNTPHY